MAKKIAVSTRSAATASQALTVSDFNELFLVSGQVDQDQEGNCRHPDDPVGQSRGILQSLVEMLEQAGWSLNDVIRTEITVSKEVDVLKHRAGILGAKAEIFKDVDPKPVSGPFTCVHALGLPGFLVEYEILAAR